MTTLARSLALALTILANACIVGDPPADPGSSGGPVDPTPVPPGPDPGPGPDPSQGVPPMVTERPSASQGSSCGGVAPITLAQPVTANGCSLAAGARSGCPALRPSNRSMDGLFSACLLGRDQLDCQLGSPFVECPVGHNAGPFSIVSSPPAGQAGYGFQVDVTRAYVGGSITLQYDARETGVRADGTIAWTGPHATGSASVSTGSCCDLEYLFEFPGSGLGEKIQANLQWF